MTRIRIETLTGEKPAWMAQAARVLHLAFRPINCWETMDEAREEVVEMLAPDRFVRVAILDHGDGNDEVVGWVGGIPQYDGNV